MNRHQIAAALDTNRIQQHLLQMAIYAILSNDKEAVEAAWEVIANFMTHDGGIRAAKLLLPITARMFKPNMCHGMQLVKQRMRAAVDFELDKS